MCHARGLIGRSAFVTLTVLGGTAAPLAAQGIRDLGALGSRDPGRFLPAPVTAPGVKAQRLVQLPTYAWSVMPSLASAVGVWTYGVSARFINSGLLTQLPFSVSLTDKVVSGGGVSHNRIQIDGEIHHGLFDDKTMITGTADYQHTAGVSTSQEYAVEVDRDLLKTTGHDVWIGVIGVYDRASPAGGPTSDGLSLAADVSWSIGDATEIDAEYDFNSSFNGEDNYSVRAVRKIQGLPGKPQVIVGGGKHSLVLAGIRLLFP